MDSKLIAPCGMNCSLCYAYQREKNKCSGCRSDLMIPNACQRCIIRNCEHLESKDTSYCYECIKFPCLRLKQLDKRYRSKYHMSMIDNLNNIKENGIEAFLISEEKWKCKECGHIICVHHKICDNCLKEYQFDK